MQFLVFDDLEVEFLRINDLNDGCASLIFKLHREQATDETFVAFRHRKGKRFKLAGVEIGDDEQPVAQPAQEGAEHQTLNSGDTQQQPASVTGQLPARVNSYTKLGGMRRNNPAYQGFLFEVIAPILDLRFVPPVEPIARREAAAEVQRAFCKVASLKDIHPNTEASLRFDLLETAFDAESRGLDPTIILAGYA